MSNYNQTGSFTEEPSISEHNDYAELRDEEITSPYTVIRGFDELMSCFSLGAQMVHYYRYGKRRDCDLQWEKFKFCMSLSTYRTEEKKRRIIEFEKKLESRRQGQKSSLDIWELRKAPPKNFPPSFKDSEPESSYRTGFPPK